MKVLKLIALAALAVVITGCGNKPKLPEGTLAAVYVDLGKTISSGKDISKMVIKNLPKEFKGEKIRENVEKEYEEGLKSVEEELKKNKLSFSSFKWAIAAAGMDAKGRQSLYAVVCIDGLDIPEDILSKMKSGDKIAGEDVYETPFEPFGNVVIFDKKYILGGNSKEALETLVKTYKGDKPCVDGFDDLCDLDGATIARLQIDGISKLLTKSEFEVPCADGTKRTPAEAVKYALKGIDEDLADYIAEFEGVKIDLNVADDELGMAFTAVCGSKAAAKLVEKVFGSLQVSGRLFADVIAVAIRDYANDALRQVNRSLASSVDRKLMQEMRDSKMMSCFVKRIAAVGQDIEVDRSGSETTIKFGIPLDDIVEDVLDNAEELAKKL